MILYNRTKGIVLAERLGRADDFPARLKGLLGTASLARGHGLWISPCRSVHTIGMRYPIDVVFVDADGRVVALLPDLAPYRLTRCYPGAKSVVELPAGTIRSTGTAPDDLLEFGPGDAE